MKLHKAVAATVLLGLTLTACGGGTAPPAQAQNITTINGIATNAPSSPVTLVGSGRALASAQTDTSGNFALNLPSDSGMNALAAPLNTGLLSDLGCTGTLKISDPATRGYGVASLQVGSAVYLNATVSKTLLSRTLRGKVYLYVDRSSTATGTLDCSAVTGLPTTVAVNLSVSKGWNVLALGVDGSVGLGGVGVAGRLDNGAGAVGDVSTWTNQEQIRADLGL